MAYLFFFHIWYMYIGRSYWVRDGCSATFFVFISMSKLSSSKFCHSTQSSADALNYCCFVVKAPANAIMQHKQRQLRQNQF